MSGSALMLRGINLGPSRRVPMADLRALLSDAGYDDVRTYVQSGNVVVANAGASAKLEQRARELISERFGFDVPVVVRTGDELEAVLKRNPLRKVATEDKLYQVTFLADPLDSSVVESLQALVTDEEALVVDGGEVYTWHSAGVARSKLASALASSRLGVTATARNWRTVTTLAEMCAAAGEG